MKKLLILALMLAVSGTAFAGGWKPPVNPCKDNCAAKYGNPFKPNYQYAECNYVYNATNGLYEAHCKIDETGKLVELPVCTTPRQQCWGWMGRHDCACYDPALKTYQPNEYLACTKGC